MGMRGASSFLIACLGSVCACLLSGCAGGHAGATANASTNDAASMAVVDDWYFEDDGSVIIIPDKAGEVSPTHQQTIALTFHAFTIIGAEMTTSGGIRAIEIKPMPGMKDGDWFLCKALRVDLETKTAEFDFGVKEDDCCQMKCEMVGTVVRLSCSGNCDNGEACELLHEMEQQINVWTCVCPAVP
jgi:hypothetical protein